MIKLIGNGRLITRNKDNQFIENGCIAFKENKIIDYGKTPKLKDRYPSFAF